MQIEVKLTANAEDIEKFVRKFASNLIADAVVSFANVASHYATEHGDVITAAVEAMKRGLETKATAQAQNGPGAGAPRVSPIVKSGAFRAVPYSIVTVPPAGKFSYMVGVYPKSIATTETWDTIEEAEKQAILAIDEHAEHFGIE